MPSDIEAIEFYFMAHEDVISNGYQDEIKYVDKIPKLKDQTDINFLQEYIWVVLNAGMKEQIARKIYQKFIVTKDFNVIGHQGKREAIYRASLNYQDWFKLLQKSSKPIEYLETLPWIGPVTKYHLARNIGLDTVKPDRHLMNLSRRFGFPTPLEMCQTIQKITNESLGVIDVVLWRYCNLHGS